MLKKSLGQHLLKDKNLLKKMVRLSGIGPEDVVAEIGPGHGDLTRCIAPSAGFVYAIELDQRFRPILEPLEREFSNVQIVFADVLKTDFAGFRTGPKIVVVGNIPYNITGEILFKLLEEKAAVRGAYLTMQKEVAERLVSRSHHRSYGALSVIFQLFATVKLHFLLKPSLFVPPPKVESAFVSVVFKDDFGADLSKDGVTADAGLITFVKACFLYKRKFLRHSLEVRYDPDEVDDLYRHMAFSRSVRAEEIEPEVFVPMYGFLNERRGRG